MGSSRPLGDTPDRSYAAKLERFARFVEPELKKIFADFAFPKGSAVLDLGCGAGLATAWLEAGIADGIAVGADLSLPHLQSASQHHRNLVRSDASQLAFRDSAFDFIWSCNTLNHVAEPVAVLSRLRGLLRAGGRVAVAQSGFLPDMFFAWDAPLDEAVRAACHRYYRERYGLEVTDTARLRNLLNELRSAGFVRLAARTHVIERTQPLSYADRDYLQHAIFEGAWGEKIYPFMEQWDVARLRRNCDPASIEYCLDREDFHHVQTLTVCEGRT
ncbi:MAG TPA: methyltransferase domain-containing protein [Steroidobacteraceae bacterium]|nr:methyltransferase domain-containing protein [Steroidobacteraceae bacterium]